MHSLPSRRRLPQPNFFRSKCYRLSPVPVPGRPPPPLPPPAAAPVPGLLPAPGPGLPSRHAPAPVPPSAAARPHTLARPPAAPPAAAGLPARRAAAAAVQTRPPAAGTVRKAGARPGRSSVGRQGCRTLSQSANRDSVTPTHTHRDSVPPPSASSRVMKMLLPHHPPSNT